MASRRLTNEDRRIIVEGLQEPLRKKISELKKSFVKEVVNPFFHENTPQEIRDFDKKYPNMLEKSDYVYFHFIFNENLLKEKGLNSYESLRVLPYYPSYFEEMICRSIKDFPESQEFLEEYAKLLKQQKEVKGKATCILEKINTTKQLEEQFPEAYSILIGIDVKQSDCDNIESFRAQLSKFSLQ